MNPEAYLPILKIGLTIVSLTAFVIINEDQKTCIFNNSMPIRSGDYLSIDGHDGVLYQGLMPVMEE